MKTLLICHDDAALHREGIARWLASFSTLSGIVILHEKKGIRWRRVRREVRRVGFLRFLDGLAFRAYYKLFIANKDRAWLKGALRSLCERHAPVAANTAVLHAESPNSASCQQFIEHCSPDLVIALCKTILKPQIFSIPTRGTFVLHPGTCPEYRNAHGCFWALANDDLDKVAMTLLRVDAGVDTGPVYGYFTYRFDEVAESHIVIQHRVVLENLSVLQQRLTAISHGTANSIDTSARPSAMWGQPWLTTYLRWKYKARKRKANASPRPALS